MPLALTLLTLLFQFQNENIVFDLRFPDLETGSGIGFDDPELGEQRRVVVYGVVTYLTEILGDIGRLEVELRTAAVSDPEAPPLVARPFFDDVGGFTRNHAYQHLVTLTDPCRLDNCDEDRADMEIVVDFSFPFHLGEDPPPSDSYDFFSLILAQMVRGLGIYSLVGEDGSSRTGSGALSRFDALLATAEGTRLFDDVGQFQVDPATLTGGGIRFAGQRAALALGRAPEVLSDGPFLDEVTLSFFDPDIADAVTVFPLPMGTAKRQLALFEFAALTDLGYTLGQSTTLVYPWISNSDEFTSTLVLNNPGGEEARVALTATRADGTRVASRRTVPARGFLSETAEALFPDLGRGAGITVVVTTDRAGMTGRWVTADRPALVPSQGLAIPLPPGLSSDRIGQTVEFGFLPGNADFIAAPVLVNLGSEPATIDLYRLGPDGTSSDPLRLADLPPFRPQVLLVTEATSGDSQVIVQSTGQPITGVVFVFNDRGQTAIGNASRLESFTPPDQP